MHVVRLLSPKLDNETHTKDIDFSPAGIRPRWEAGYADTDARARAPAWIGEFGLLDGVILHEPRAGRRASGRESEPSGRAQKPRPNRDRGPAQDSPRSEGGRPMNVCTGISAIQLIAAASDLSGHRVSSGQCRRWRRRRPRLITSGSAILRSLGYAASRQLTLAFAAALKRKPGAPAATADSAFVRTAAGARAAPPGPPRCVRRCWRC